MAFYIVHGFHLRMEQKETITLQGQETLIHHAGCRINVRPTTKPCLGDSHKRTFGFLGCYCAIFYFILFCVGGGGYHV